MSVTIALRLEHAIFPMDDADAARQVDEILTRPIFSELRRMSAMRKDRWVNYKKKAAGALAEYLLDPANDSLYLDNGRSRELVATAQVSAGRHERRRDPTDKLIESHVVMPWQADQRVAVLNAYFDLARALDARSGAVCCEPDFGFAHKFGLAFWPSHKQALLPLRYRERKARARAFHADDVSVRLAGPEWGVLLGPGHLDRVTAEALEASGVFARVTRVTPTLVWLQLTDDPADVLRDGFDDKLDAARAVLAPILMDLADIPLD